MSAPSQRSRRIADLIRRNLALILKKEMLDPRLIQVTLTHVDVSPDLKQAKIYCSLIQTQETESVLAVLNKASGFLRSMLAHACKLRYTPRLIFIHDNSLIHAQHMDQLFHQLEQTPSFNFDNIESDDDKQTKT